MAGSGDRPHASRRSIQLSKELVRYFAKEDDPIFAYDAELQQWRRVPDEATFQALGFYKCDMTMADVGFFEQVEIGPAYPVSETPARKDYPHCRTG